MYLLKNKNIFFGILLSGIFLLLCLPNSLKQILTLDFFDLTFLIFSIIYIPFFIKTIINFKTNKVYVLIYIYIALCFITSFVANDFILQRFFIGILFFLPFFIISDIRWDKEKLIILKYVALFTFFFLSMQVVLASLGIMKFNNTEVQEVGAFNRVGTTAGVATFTAPVIITLFGILNILYKSRLVKFTLLSVTLVSVFLSGTRSALLVIVFSLFLNLILVIKLKYKLFLILFTIILIPIADSKFKIYETLEARNQNAKDYSDGDVTSGRVKRWMYIYDKIDENPEILLTGIGGGNAPYFNKYLKTKLQATSSPHNVYLAVLYEHGFIILFVFFGILFLLTKKALRKIHLSSLIFIFTLLITFNTEVFPLGSGFSSLFFLLYFLLINDKKINFLLKKNA